MAPEPRPFSEYRLGQLSGRVRCASTGKILESAKIIVEPADAQGDVRWNVIPHGFSDSEGRFHFENVPVSSYYVWARRRGFVSRVALLTRPTVIPTPPLYLFTPREWLDSNVDRVTVHEGAESFVEVSLQIAGSISGTVYWRDGSPAKGYQLCLARACEDGAYTNYLHRAEGGGWSEDYRTDDKGRFLLEDVVEGSYILGARVLPYVEPRLLRLSEWTASYFASFYWTGNESVMARATSFQVVSGMETRVDLRLPMLEQESIPPLPRD